MIVEQVVEAVFADVFADVTAIRDALIARVPLTSQRIGEIRPLVADLLLRPDQPAVGAGVILEPGLLPEEPLRLDWWQHVDGALQALDADLNPGSLGFYDYAVADWFAVPRRTRNRHVVGPYVDVHGTERYTLTLTLPVVAGTDFLGVAGADVPLDSFERRVLAGVGAAADFVVVNGENRVVVSTRSETPPGSLLPAATSGATLDLGWQVRTPAL